MSKVPPQFDPRNRRPLGPQDLELRSRADTGDQDALWELRRKIRKRWNARLYNNRRRRHR